MLLIGKQRRIQNKPQFYTRSLILPGVSTNICFDDFPAYQIIVQHFEILLIENICTYKILFKATESLQAIRKQGSIFLSIVYPFLQTFLSWLKSNLCAVLFSETTTVFWRDILWYQYYLSITAFFEPSLLLTNCYKKG